VIKTGGQHLGSIHDDRTVFLDGGAVADATTDPAYRNAAVTAGRLYDIQAPPELMAQYDLPDETPRSRRSRRASASPPSVSFEIVHLDTFPIGNPQR